MGPLDATWCSQPLTIHKCYRCNYQTLLKSISIKHNLNCNRKAGLTLSCNKCDFSTYSRLILLKHKWCGECLKTNYELSCDVNVCVFKTCYGKKSLERHLKAIHNFLCCPHCSYKTKNKSTLTTHKSRKHHPQDRVRMYLCEHCGYKAKESKSDLQKHIKRIHTVKDNIKPVWFSCPHCHFRSEDKSSVDEHLLHNHLSLDYVPWVICETCHYMGDTFEDCMRRHWTTTLIATVHNSERHSCKLCSFKTNRAYGLRRHLVMEHQIREELLCEHCGLQSNNGDKLKRHQVKEHFPEDQNVRYHCDKCLYKTYYKLQLRQHVLRRHISEENIQWFQCAKCSFRSKGKGDLKKHIIRKHTALEEISWHHCKLCDYKAKVKGYVTCHVRKVHKRSRTEPWLYCDFKPCRYKTRNPLCLKAHHETKHPSESNCLQQKILENKEEGHGASDVWYYCELCAYKAKFKRYLTSHIKNAHEGRLRRAPRRVPCGFKSCKFRSRNPKCLRTHQETKHPLFFNGNGLQQKNLESKEGERGVASVSVQDKTNLMEADAHKKSGTISILRTYLTGQPTELHQ